MMTLIRTVAVAQLPEHRVAVRDGAGATRRASSARVVGGNKRSADTKHPLRGRPQDG
jgi:hypothetical protein